MSTLEGLVAQILGLSGSSADLSSLLGTLKQSESLLRANQGGLLTAVANLEAGQHSLGCVFLLEARGRATAATGDREFLAAACRFLPACTPDQVRLSPEKFTSLCRQVKLHAIELKCPKAGIWALREAVPKLCPSTDYLSPIHADLFQLCLLAKCYNAASPVLDLDVYSVDPAKTACTPTDVLLYCYYGAMIEIGRRRYSRALQLLLTALTAPTMVLNAITVACLKKYILVQLLTAGAVAPLPKYAHNIVTRAQKSECGPYLELAKQCGPDSGKSPAQLAAYAASKRADFEQDGNMGLVLLVVEAATRRRIQRLTDTYLTLPLGAIAEKAGGAAGGLVGPGEAELAVLRLIDGGQVFARISERDGMVEFLDDPEAYDTEEASTRIDSIISQSQDLAGRLAALDHAVSMDRAYLNKTELRAQRGGGRGGGDEGGFADVDSFKPL